MPVRAVLLDLGGTLLALDPVDDDEASRHMAARLRPVLARHGFTDFAPLDELAPRYEEAQQQALAETMTTLRQFDGGAVLCRVLADLGYALTPEQAQEVARAGYPGFAAYGGRPFADAAETLRALRDRGLRIAIVSNASWGADDWQDEFRAFGWLPYLDAVVSSRDVQWCKPHPAPFRRALDALDVRPQEALMVGDTVEADVAGAQALGMPAAWKRNARPLPPSAEAAYTIDHLAELPDLAPLRDA